MPLEARPITRLDAPIIKKPSSTNELHTRLQALYQHSHPDAPEALDVIATSFLRGGCLYVGMFNDKPIAALACFDDGQTDAKRLQYLSVHPQNENRGIEGKLIKMVYDAEVSRGTREFVPAEPLIHQIMSEYDMLRVKG